MTHIKTMEQQQSVDVQLIQANKQHLLKNKKMST